MKSFFKIQVNPVLPSKKSDYKSIFKRAKNEFDPDIYSHAFCLIDLDYIHRNGKMDDYCAEKEDILKIKNMYVIESCPCIEYWFLLHYEYMFQSSYECSSIIDKLRLHIPDYKKNMQEIYEKICKFEQRAFNHSAKAKKQRQDDINHNIIRLKSPVTHTNVDELINFIKNNAPKRYEKRLRQD